MHTTASETDPAKNLLAALGRIPSGLFVVSLRHGKNETAMLASWIQQCSFDPPLVSIAFNGKRWFVDWLKEGAALGVSVLGEGQKELMSHFGKGFEKDEPPFEGIDVDREGTAPILLAAHAALTGKVKAKHEAGDHLLVIAEIDAGRVQHEGRPGVHVRRSGAHY